MSKRVSLPGADDLFRPTSGGKPAPVPSASAQPPTAATSPRRGRRAKHDEKITVYLTSEELLRLEQVRLELRRDYDLSVDRGRLVRTAVEVALAELDAHGSDSELVRRLSS